MAASAGEARDTGAATSLPADLLRFHGKYAPYAAKEPLCTGTIERRGDSLGMVLAGGTPFCPCIYVETITHATLLATFELGDEIVAINKTFLLGLSLEEANALWQQSPADSVEVIFRKLPEQLPLPLAAGPSTLLRRTRLQFAEYFKENENFLDVLGIRRGIVVMDQDDLEAKREQLQRHIAVYTGLAPLLQRYIAAYTGVIYAQEDMAVFLTDVSLRERTTALCEPVLAMAESHRSVAKYGRQCVQRLQQVAAQIGTVIAKVHPDIGLSLDKYESQRSNLILHAVRLDELQTKDAAARTQGGCTPESFTGNYELRDALRTCARTKRTFERMHADISQKLDICRAQNIHDICTHMAGIAVAIHDCLDLCNTATAIAEQIVSRCPDTALHTLRALEPTRSPAAAAAVAANANAHAFGRRSTTPSDRSPSVFSFDSHMASLSLSLSLGPTSSLALGTASVTNQSASAAGSAATTPRTTATTITTAAPTSAPPSLRHQPAAANRTAPVFSPTPTRTPTSAATAGNAQTTASAASAATPPPSRGNPFLPNSAGPAATSTPLLTTPTAPLNSSSAPGDTKAASATRANPFFPAPATPSSG